MILGVRVHLTDGKLTLGNSADPRTVFGASEICPGLEILEVNTDSVDSFRFMGRFVRLRRLTMNLVPYASPPPDLDDVIFTYAKHVSLEGLSVTNFNTVRLSSIARHSGKTLDSLLLTGCNVAGEVVSQDAFPKLENLTLGKRITGSTLNSLLAACPSLKSLQLRHQDTCAMFLKDVITSRRTKGLERLILCTDASFSKMRIDAGNLRTLLAGSPSLRHVATDSYELRVFFENEAPHVNLAWTSCTICTANTEDVFLKHI